MKKKYLLLLFVLFLLLGGVIYKYNHHRQAITKSAEHPPKSINRDRMHYTTTTNVTEAIEGFPKGIYKAEVWFDRTANKQRHEMYFPDGMLRAVELNVQTEKGFETYKFNFDPQTKTGRFDQLPINSGSFALDDSFDKNSSGEYFERMKKLTKEDKNNPPLIEEVQVDGKNVYKITSFFNYIDKTKPINTITLLDKETLLPYQTMTRPEGKTFKSITTYTYIWGDYSDTVFTPQPPKGYTLTK